VLVLGVFHFINRIADLLHVDAEALPEPLRRFESLRRLGVRIASRILARGDMQNRPYAVGWDDARSRIAPLLERHDADALRTLASRPKLVEALQLALEERDRSSVDRATLARIHRTVEAALPVAATDVEGFHARPPDPVEAFAFVGTRYAYRATAAMIDVPSARAPAPPVLRLTPQAARSTDVPRCRRYMFSTHRNAGCSATDARNEVIASGTVMSGW
jgi:hypothetical protein